jgi:glycosyltransferase involved in cell wall biosynthesis
VAEPVPAPLEVTIVANDIAPEGGMELQLRTLIGGLLAAGDRVTVVSWTCSLPPHPNLRWIRVPGPSRPFALAYPLFLALASLAVATRGRGVLHSTGAIVLNRTAVATVHFCHHAFEEPAHKRASRPGLAFRANAWAVRRLSLWAERWCYSRRRTHRLVAVSSGLAHELREHFPSMADHTTVIPNGVDTRRFHPAVPIEGSGGDPERTSPQFVSEGSPPDPTLHVLFIGGDWERKGLRPAIEALAACPGADLTVVGSGDVESYRALARAAGVADRVDFAGPTDDPAPAYRAADAFLLPTAYESFSLVTYEAAASGLPLLATRVNGIEDLLRDGENGWFVDRSPERIAARLRALRDDPTRRRAMGAAARHDSLAYSWESVIARYRAIYASAAR